MDHLHDEKIAFFDHLDELVLSPTSYTSTFCNIHPNEVWVKCFFLMVPHEEYRLPISPFDDDMTRVPSSLHLWQHLVLHYDDIHIQGCIDETSLSHLKSSCFLCSLFGSDCDGCSSFTSCTNTKARIFPRRFSMFHTFWCEIGSKINLSSLYRRLLITVSTLVISSVAISTPSSFNVVVSTELRRYRDGNVKLCLFS